MQEEFFRKDCNEFRNQREVILIFRQKNTGYFYLLRKMKKAGIGFTEWIKKFFCQKLFLPVHKGIAK